MLLLRAFILELLVCFTSSARRFCFAVFFEGIAMAGAERAELGVMAAVNFLEHFHRPPYLGWLLPVSVGGLLWAMNPARVLVGGPAAAGDFFSSSSFQLGSFRNVFNPEILGNTEGVADMARNRRLLHGRQAAPDRIPGARPTITAAITTFSITGPRC